MALDHDTPEDVFKRREEELLLREQNLLVCLTVYDAIVSLLKSCGDPKWDFATSGQIKAAEDAYRQIVGEEPMSTFKRELAV